MGVRGSMGILMVIGDDIYPQMEHILLFEKFKRRPAKDGVTVGLSDLTGTKVSNNGEPVTVYHGTNTNFDKFDMSWQGQTDEGFYGRGFYFALEKEHAAEYGSKVLKCFLDTKNPFYLRTWNTIGSYEEIELREDLSKLKGVDPDIRPIRTLPKGYELKVEEDRHYRGDVVTRIGVCPKQELWDSDDVVYGDDIYLRTVDAKDPVKLKGYSELAIVQFNDLLNGVELKSGLASWLLQSLDRWNFTDLLEKNGYDGLFVVGNKGQETPIEEVKEILVWNTDQIHIIR